MSDLFGKLNVLVKSNLRNALSLDRRKRPAFTGGSPSLEKDISALRQRINQALDDEDRLLQEIQALRDEAVEWDRKADMALSSGDESNARYAVQQMQLKQQQAGLLQADLEQHRLSVTELIRQVNELEALAAESEAASREADATGQVDSRTVLASVPDAEASAVAGVQTASAESSAESSAADDERLTDDDLAQRRARLSQ